MKTYHHKSIQHLHGVYSCVLQTHYGYSQLVDPLILYRINYPARSLQFLPHKKHVLLLLQMEVPVDDRPLFHHLHSRNHHTLFPTLHHGKLQHDLHSHQYHQQGECHLQYNWFRLHNRKNMVKYSVGIMLQLT